MARNPTSPRSGKPIRLITLRDDTDATMVADILRSETVGGILMLAATMAALIWANARHASYEHVQHLMLGPMSVGHWATDGLLTIFFFIAGLELKRELTLGVLSRPADALVPGVAAVAGMAIPAGIYLLINQLTPGGNLAGWAIPMATDIAFALAVLAVVAPGLPTSLRAFLLTLAIVDDLGAIIVIATVFTAHVGLVWLAGAVACAAVWWALQRKRVDHWFIFIPLFALCWWCMYSSGVHATLAGVLLGLLTRSTRQHDPVDRWEHSWRPVSAGFAVPLFALLSAGVPLDKRALTTVLTSPVPLGIIVALIVGKAAGVFGGAYLTARFTRAELAPDLRWREIFSVGVLAGIGFTVALLIAELAFPGAPALVEQAKAAVLVASIGAALIAAVSLRRRTAERDRPVPDPSG